MTAAVLDPDELGVVELEPGQMMQLEGGSPVKVYLAYRLAKAAYPYVRIATQAAGAAIGWEVARN